ATITEIATIINDANISSGTAKTRAVYLGFLYTEWMRARWTSDPCYSFYGVDGSDCSFLIYLSEAEWFCPPLAWRNQSRHPTTSSLPKRQRVGSGKESLSFMRRRMRRLAAQWAAAACRLDERLRGQYREQKRILVHVGFLTEESGDVFSPKVLKGGPLGEMVQWADILTTLHVLGHNLKISLSNHIGVRIVAFMLVVTPFLCHIRVIDTFGTEPAYNNEEYSTLHGYRTNWGYWNLNCKQYMTMFPHTPDNSFMGFVTEELNQTERFKIKRDKVNNMAVVYGKEASMWKEKLLTILHRYMDIHGTVYYEAQRPPEVPAFVRNHGLLPQQELQQLLRKAKLFLGFGFPYEGPAPLEAIANGCVFLQPKFSPPHSSLNHEFFRGKPTSREVSSQHPYTEQYIGKPHVITVDFNNSQEFETAVQDILKEKVNYPFLQRPNSTALIWAPNITAPACWPPLSALQLFLSPEASSCVKTCRDSGLICEPAYFPFINNMEYTCEAVHVDRRECFQQKEPLLFSCAGVSAKHQRLCPCRDYLHGQVALCRDCL
uniref:alpha-1,6-mannosyl-glycoprotein 6-beta-N-acetylglucosaminyltransferase n=1 Tax=Sinocyclocheilus anshuiensis TaxID=1608454 RepID=A0A671K6T3_9TELE